MKKIILGLVLVMSVFALSAQEEKAKEEKKSAYEFTDTKKVATTPVDNQSSSGTCWSFAGTALLESEMIKNGKGEHNLSEMWIVRYTYLDKAIKYVRMHGTINFAGGGATGDAFNVIREYGIVPEEVYTGKGYGTDIHRHSELDAVLKAYVSAIVKNPNKTLTTAWLNGINGILDAYLGEVPETFTYNGKAYTPVSFAEEMALNMDDYVILTSYTHHPFYTEFILEIPDNWAWETSYNVPMNELMEIIDYSIENGYTVNWGADVSEMGFLRKNGEAYAIIPPLKIESKEDSEEARWVTISDKDRKNMLTTLTEPIEPIEITQEMRQVAFDNYQTTDDHGMLITGIATDQNGNKFYLVKNSWGTDYGFSGYLYASEPFVEYKTMNIAVNKNAISKAIRKKLGIK